jgi:AAA family ATP:ADP antiporter
VGRAFFIWTSVFNLFVVSVFWALMVDVFDSEQGKRLFGFIAAGATLGGIAGSSITASLAKGVPATYLLLGSVVLLEAAVFSVRRLSQLSDVLHRRPAESGEPLIGGNVLSGVTHAFKSPYLINVSVYILLFAITSTFLISNRRRSPVKALPMRRAHRFLCPRGPRVNVLTLGRSFFSPAASFDDRCRPYVGDAAGSECLGFRTLAMIADHRRSGLSGAARGKLCLARPSREVLFTVVPRRINTKRRALSTR